MTCERRRSGSNPLPFLRVAAVALMASAAGCADHGSSNLAAYLVPEEEGGAHLWSPPAPELDESVQLIGMDATGVVALLGKPSFRRRESDAQYWRYSFSGCVVDIYVYRDERSDRDHVVHYDLHEPWRPPRMRRSPAQNCDVLARRLVRDSADDAFGLPSIRTH